MKKSLSNKRFLEPEILQVKPMKRPEGVRQYGGLFKAGVLDKLLTTFLRIP
jgi:hypothetical protein